MRKTSFITGALIVVAVAVSGAPVKPSGKCVGLSVSAPEVNAGQPATSFSAAEVLDIEVSAFVNPGLANQLAKGEHLLEYRVFTPEGSLYQSAMIPVTMDKSRKGAKQKVDRYPRPVDVQLMRDASFGNGRALQATFALPVAGTVIVSNSLYGSWSAQVFVDGEPQPCSSPVTFQIKP